MQYEIRFMAEDGHVAHLRFMECEDDDVALERTAMAKHPHALELWQDDRCVWRFEGSAIR